MRRIVCDDSDVAAAIAEIRRSLSVEGDVISPSGRTRTIEVFGEPLTPNEVVRRICRQVQEQGHHAVFRYTQKFDGVRLNTRNVRVRDEELGSAHRGADAAFLAAVRRIRSNICQFQTGLLSRDAHLSVSGKYDLQLRYRPLRRVGVCIPGGAAAYPSTILMTVVPAQAAGVQQIAVVSPPTPNGANNPDVQAVCHELGITELYRIGGAQAVAALAYGCEGIEPVDKIVGPGNLFVTLAKREVYGRVDIDMMAGPTEVVVIADETANPHYVASDLISQAEHSPGVSLLVAWHAPLIDRVAAAVATQLRELPRGALARDSLDEFGALILARDCDQAIELANCIAPEHLEIMTADPAAVAKRVHSAGAIFLGAHTPVAVGDYVAGPSHVLPTGGSARFASGLCANDFLKRTSIMRFSPEGLSDVADDLRLLAEKEGLTGHSASVDIRLREASELS